MKKLSAVLCTIVLVFGVMGTTNAALTTIGTASYDSDGNGTPENYNLIYEDNSIYGGLVWLDYSNGSNDWQNQVNWASRLGDYITVDLLDGFTTTIDWGTGWRLPLVGDNPQVGYNQNTSEMGHLYYASLGQPSGGPLGNISPFNNLLPESYWYGESETPPPPHAWDFATYNGNQDVANKVTHNMHALAVHPGQVSAVPLPGAVWLLGSGFIGLLGFRKRFNKE